jgi:outer membrane protein assembly factor BamB
MRSARFSVFAVLLECGLLSAQDWREFRGPNRAGTTAHAVRLPVELDSAANMAWSIDVPMGRSSPIVTGPHLFLTAASGSELFVLEYDARTGKPGWRYTLPLARHGEIDANRNDPASPTPVTDGQAVYAFFPDFGLAALSMDGELRWKLPLPGFVNTYGMASSPVIHRGIVYLQCDQVRGSFLIAVDARSGRIRWRKEREGTLEGWATPLIVEKSGELVALSANGLEVLDGETGETRWSVPTGGGMMIPSPIFDGDTVIATFRGSDQPVFPSWEKMVEVDADQDGKLSPPEAVKRLPAASFNIADPNRDGFITQPEWNAFRNRGVGDFGFTKVDLGKKTVVWRYKRGIPYVPSPVVYGDVVYSIRTGGILTAIDRNTGELLKEGRWPEGAGDYFASPIAAEGKVYVASADGKVSVVRAGPDWELLHVNDLHDRIAATPAIAAGALFVRTHSKLYCFRVK